MRVLLGDFLVFSSYIVWYLFLAGVASGAFLVASICCAVDAVRRTRSCEELAGSAQSGFLIAPVTVALAALFLVLDLGSPERAWLVLLAPFESIVATGAWLVMLFFIVSCAAALCGLFMREVPQWLLWTSWIVGGFLAIGVMTYTGLLLSDLVAIDFWYTWLLPVLFVVSSIATGLAAILVVDALMAKHVQKTARSLWAVGAVLGVFECIVVAVFLVGRFMFSEAARASCEMLLFGDLAAFFWVGVVACGLIGPLLVHILATKVRGTALILVSSAGVLAGGFFVRYCIVNAALFTPMTLGGFA